MPTIALKISDIFYNEKDSNNDHLQQHHELFAVLQQMQALALAMTYYWSGNNQQCLQLFLTVSLPNKADIHHLMVYLNRHFDNLALDYEKNYEPNITQCMTSFEHGHRLFSTQPFEQLDQITPVPQALADMSSKLSHWHSRWLLRISLHSLTPAQSKQLQLNQQALTQWQSLQHPLSKSPQTSAAENDNGLLHYRMALLTDTVLQPHHLMILRQGFNGNWRQSLQMEKMNREARQACQQIDQCVLDYSKPLSEMVIPVNKAHHVLQFPRVDQFYSHWPVNSRARLPAPASIYSEGICLGDVEGIVRSRPCCIMPDDLSRHAYVVGKTGTGKSTVLMSMIASAIEQADQAVFVLDPHGDLTEDVLKWLPPDQAERVVYIDFANSGHYPGINILSAENEQARHYAITQLDQFFLSMYGPEIWGPRIQDVFRNLAQLLNMDSQEPGTLIDLIWAVDLNNKTIRSRFEKIAQQCNRIMSILFMQQIRVKLSGDGSLQELTAYFRSKFSPLVDVTALCNILGQSHSTLDFKHFVRERKICLFNLNKSQLSGRNAELLGMILSTQIFQTAMANGLKAPKNRLPMTLFADEFQTYMSNSLSEMLSEARKFRLSLVLANQYLSQVKSNTHHIGQQQSLHDAILGNVGSLVSFRLSHQDASVIADELGGAVSAEQLATLPNWQAICRIAQNKVSLPVFSLTSKPLSTHASAKQIQQIKNRSLSRYCRPKEIVEHEIRQRLETRLGIAKKNKQSLSAFAS